MDTKKPPPIAEHLSKQSLFRNLPAAALAQLAQVSSIALVNHGEHVFHQGDSTQALYVILSGTVAISQRDAQARELILSHLHAGDYMGELHVADGLAHSADALALSDVSLIKISRDGLLRCMQAAPEIALAMLADLSKRLRIADTRSQALAFQNVKDRLYAALHEDAAQPSRPVGTGRPRSAGFSATYLAKRVGCSRETAARALADMQSRGLVQHSATGWSKLDASAPASPPESETGP